MNNNLKPFDLKRALAGDPVITRDGAGVLQLAHLSKWEAAFPLIALLTHKRQSQHTFWYTSEGKYNIGDHESPMDLFMVPIEREYWCISAWHIENNCVIFSSVYSSEGLEYKEYKELYTAWVSMGTLKDFHEHKITRLE